MIPTAVIEIMGLDPASLSVFLVQPACRCTAASPAWGVRVVVVMSTRLAAHRSTTHITSENQSHRLALEHALSEMFVPQVL